MSELFDKRLADKIRLEMAAYEAPYNPADWRAMQSKLKHSRSRGLIYMNLTTSIAASTLLAIASFAYFHFVRPSSQTTVADNLAADMSVEQLINREISNAARQRADVFVFANEPLSGQKSVIGLGQVASSHTATEEPTAKMAQSVNFEADEAIFANTANTQHAEALSFAKVNYRQAGEHTTVVMLSQLERAITATAKLVSTNKINNMTLANLNQSLGQVTSTRLAAQANKNDYVKSVKFIAGVTAGLGTGASNAKKGGFWAGIVGSLFLGKHLSAETGLVFTKQDIAVAKRYHQVVLSYEPYLITKGIAIEATEANITALNMPVGFKYNRGRFSIKSGIDNMLVLNTYKEEQTPDVRVWQGPQAPPLGAMRNVEERTNKFVAAANVYVALGVQTMLSDRQILEIEPFVRIPANKLGVDQTTLGTIGVNTKLMFTGM